MPLRPSSAGLQILHQRRIEAAKACATPLEVIATTPEQKAPPPFPLPGGVMPSRTWEEELALRDASKPIEFAFTAEVEECVPGLKSIVEKALGGCPHNQKLLRSMGTRKE